MLLAAHILNDCESSDTQEVTHFQSRGLTCLPCEFGRLHRKMNEMSTIKICSKLNKNWYFPQRT